MNGFERYINILNGEAVDFLPRVPILMQFAAEYIGSKYAIAVNSCTAGLHIALTALGIGPGDEVIVPTFTFCSTANVVVHLGARPILVDVGDDLLARAQSDLVGPWIVGSESGRVSWAIAGHGFSASIADGQVRLITEVD